MSVHKSTARTTVRKLKDMKANGEKIACLTAYDVSFAQVLDQNGVDVVLVGDSLGMVIQGEETTLPVTMDDMVYHGRAVSRGVKQ
ncbi:MAG TPA: 3-methyl-2-oxobutanoate hydroxymethyltransferase, partial [Gammaproteobacteria bacterium]